MDRMILSLILMWIFIPRSRTILADNEEVNLPEIYGLLPFSSGEHQVSLEQVVSRTLSILLAMNEPPFLLLTEKLGQDPVIQTFLHASKKENPRKSSSSVNEESLRKKRMASPMEKHTSNELLNQMKTELDEIRNEISQLKTEISSLSRFVDNSVANLQQQVTISQSAEQSQILLLLAMKSEFNERRNEMSQLKTNISSLSEIMNKSANRLNKLETLKLSDATQMLWRNASDQQGELNTLQNQMKRLNNSVSALTNSLTNSTTRLRNQTRELESKYKFDFSSLQSKFQNVTRSVRNEIEVVKKKYQSYDNSTSFLKNELDKVHRNGGKGDWNSPLSSLQKEVQEVNRTTFRLSITEADRLKLLEILESAFKTPGNYFFHRETELNNWHVGLFVSDVLRQQLSFQGTTYRMFKEPFEFGTFHRRDLPVTEMTSTDWIEVPFGQKILFQVRNLQLRYGDSLTFYDPFEMNHYLTKTFNTQNLDFNVTSISNVLTVDWVHGPSTGSRGYDFRFDSKDVSFPVVYPVTESTFQRYIYHLMMKDCHLG